MATEAQEEERYRAMRAAKRYDQTIPNDLRARYACECGRVLPGTFLPAPLLLLIVLLVLVLVMLLTLRVLTLCAAAVLVCCLPSFSFHEFSQGIVLPPPKKEGESGQVGAKPYYHAGRGLLGFWEH